MHISHGNKQFLGLHSSVDPINNSKSLNLIMAVHCVNESLRSPAGTLLACYIARALGEAIRVYCGTVSEITSENAKGYRGI